ncbi:MAG: M48 family metallopeptidase [Bacteroidaceae bacterium]|nr:M48 family metallopeptidase [Bacteroidaceae bacterium]
MKKITYALALLATVALVGCSTVAMTGRKQLMLVSNSEVLSSSLTQYQSYMKSAKPVVGTAQAEQVVRVGKKIAAATESYLRANGGADQLSDFSWEFNLVQDNSANAFCMPGGKIVVYTGILPFASTDSELAVILGHEVAHAVAKHSNERMSQQVAAQYGGAILGAALGGQSQAVQAAAAQVYGLGAQYGVMLPFSRKHESEADYMGLILMSMAGYEPGTAVTFWQKMSAGTQKTTPEIMSTHPSDATRIADIQKELPKIRAKYYVAPAPTATTTTAAKKTTTTKKTTTKKKTSKK